MPIMNEIIERLKGPTPRVFRRVRNAGLILTGISGALLAAPVALPAVIVSAAGYLALAGAVAGALSQTAVKDAGQP
jgi:ABC-type xylose transport system permease subunit